MQSKSKIARPHRHRAVAYDAARKRHAKSRQAPNLVVLANRAPIRIVRDLSGERIEPTVGGVGSTFQRLLEEHGGTWIAWPGGRTLQKRVAMPPHSPAFDLVFVDLSERDVSQYYYGMCNQGLWPLMHYMTPICHFNRAQWNIYQRVNMNFASIAASEASSSSVVWVQDFHLAITPMMIRARRPELPIGLFWHVPFPPQEVFRVFPWRRELLAGMMGSDLIGFHTQSYASHFQTACERILGAEVDRDNNEIHFGGRTVKVGAFPLGISFEYFEGLAANARVRERALRLRRSVGENHKIVLGVDRLDYTKGLLQRILGFERFLERNPAAHRNVTLMLIAVPSRTKIREYSDLKRQVDEQIGRIIGRFSAEGWVPIRYLYTQFETEDLVPYYVASDVALLTPLRDGMNLVAKEYCASHPGDDGILILSEFAGAAEEMTEALLVNPYDIDQIASRIEEALEMPADQRTARMSALREKLRENDLERWSSSFLSALFGSRTLAQETAAEVTAD
jgi:trehalose 6-phosphate synthase/phosphatase